jgi:rfaE bifunctional protein nucleotidyltransferase chain/domain
VKKIGYTCGCYDLFHAGHLSFLEACKKECDILVVGLATDWRCRQMEKKYIERPLISYEDRNAILDALSCVDLVIPDSNGPISVLSVLHPDYYIKGCDWRDKLPNDEVIFCKELGTEIKFIDSGNQLSTSDIILKIGSLNGK